MVPRKKPGCLLAAPLQDQPEASHGQPIACGPIAGLQVLGGGVASVLTKYAGVEATAEVTAASVDNCKLVGAKKPP